MLTRLIEHLFINGFNAALSRKNQSKNEPPPRLGQTHIGRLIPLGETAPSSAPVGISEEERRRHVYILGATGTGKTNLFLHLIESDINRGRAFCVVDLRGDLVERVLLRLAASAPPLSWRDRLLLLDLRETEHVVGFNPLVGEGDAYDRALYLLAALKAHSDSWGVQIEETCRCSLIALAETGWSLLEIDPLLTNGAFRAQVLNSVSDPGVRSFFERFGRLSPTNQMTWTLPVLNKITPFVSIPALRLMFGGRQTFPLRRLLDTQPGMIILVSLAADRLHNAAHLAGGMFVSSFQNAIMSRADMPEPNRVPAHLYADDFGNLSTDRFASIVAEGRRFGLGLTLSHQNISQLPLGLRDVLRTNVHSQFYFQTGAGDATELAKEMSGTIPLKEIRSLLISQKTGQAYLVRRGQDSVRVQINYSPDPSPTLAQVKAVREVAFERYGRPRMEVEQELADRDAALRAFTSGSFPTAGTGTAPVYQISHTKTATFKPPPKPPMKQSAPQTKGAPKAMPPSPPPTTPSSETASNAS